MFSAFGTRHPKKITTAMASMKATLSGIPKSLLKKEYTTMMPAPKLNSRLHRLRISGFLLLRAFLSLDTFSKHTSLETIERRA